MLELASARHRQARQDFTTRIDQLVEQVVIGHAASVDSLGQKLQTPRISRDTARLIAMGMVNIVDRD